MAGPLTLRFSWDTAPGTTYPASPPSAWASQPREVAPSASYFTPGVRPPAPEFNYILREISDDLATINTYLKHLSVQTIPSPFGYAVTTTGIIVPGDCFWMGVFGWGGGGGGEGGCRGVLQSGSLDTVYPQGGGGAGAPFMFSMFPTNPGDTLSITVGAGGAGGSGDGGAGADGGDTIIQCTAGVFAGITYFTAKGGAGCGVGQENTSGGVGAGATSLGETLAAAIATLEGTSIVSSPGPWGDAQVAVDQILAAPTGAIAPGALGCPGGPATRMFPYVTGYGNVLISLGGVLDIGRFERRFPQRGGSVCAAGIVGAAGNVRRQSLAGAESPVNYGLGPFGGGAAGATGTDDPSGGVQYYGGCGGGGGGAGPAGKGGAGGDGGGGQHAAPGDLGMGGASAASWSGAGGGGGGCGGWGDVTAGGPGGAGGAGGSGYAFLFGVSGPPTPP